MKISVSDSLKRHPFFLLFVSAISGALLSRAVSLWAGIVPCAAGLILIFFFPKVRIISALSLMIMGIVLMTAPAAFPDGGHFIVGRVSRAGKNSVGLSDVRFHSGGEWVRTEPIYVLLEKYGAASREARLSDLFMAKVNNDGQTVTSSDFFSTRWPSSLWDVMIERGAELSDFLYSEMKTYVPRGADTLASVFLGRRDVPYELRNTYRDGGYAQIFAVSGAHVGIIALVTLVILSELIPYNTVKYPLVFFIIFCYGAVTGFSVPTFRAVFVFGLFALFKLLDRPQSFLNLVGLVGLFEIVRNGSMVFDPSFQLSYSAVVSMAILIPVMPEFRPRHLSRAINASVAANAGVIPFLILNFGKIYIASFAINAFFIPLLMAVALEGALFFSLFALAGITFLEKIAGAGISPFIGVLDGIAGITKKLPLSVVEIRPKMAAFSVTVSIFSIALFLALLRDPQNIRDKHRKSLTDDPQP